MLPVYIKRRVVVAEKPRNVLNEYYPLRIKPQKLPQLSHVAFIHFVLNFFLFPFSP